MPNDGTSSLVLLCELCELCGGVDSVLRVAVFDGEPTPVAPCGLWKLATHAARKHHAVRVGGWLRAAGSPVGVNRCPCEMGDMVEPPACAVYSCACACACACAQCIPKGY